MFSKKAYFFLIGCFSLFISGAFSQDQKIADSLAMIYNKGTVTGEQQLELLTDLSFNESKDLEKALRYADELIRLSKQSGNLAYLRRGYFIKGTKNRLLGHLYEALDAYMKCADIARQSNHLAGEGEAYAAIADIYAVAKNYTTATDYYHRGMAKLRQANGDPVNLASVILNLGDVFLKAGIYDSALFSFNEAKMIFDKVNHQTGIGYCIGNTGMVYARTGKDDLAEEKLNQAIRILEETQDYYPVCGYLLSLADLSVKKGNRDSALTYATRSLGLAEANALPEQIADASFKLSTLYESAGNTSEALKYLKKHILYRDSVYNISTLQKMYDQRTSFEVAQIQKEVNMLNSIKEKQRIIVISLFIILALALLLSGALYWFFKSKSKEKVRVHEQELLKAKLEIQEQTYLNISQELHDNIGQVLSLVKMNINSVDKTDSDSGKEKLAEAAGHITKVIQDIRDISKTLNTDFLHDIGLPNAIDHQLQLLKRTGLYATQFVVKGDIAIYEPERELLVFRVVQELLNNITKHAKANEIVVSMIYEPSKLLITVADNGTGFDVQSQPLSSGTGLGFRNIHNRLRLIRGAIHFKSEPGKGTTASIEIAKRET